MAKRINFEDNIFFINLVIRLSFDALNLDLDRDMFHTKMAENLSFINQGLLRVFQELQANPRLVDLEEQAINLLEAEDRFSSLLAALTQGKSPELCELAESLRTVLLNRKVEIQGLCTLHPTSEEDPSFVSQSELSELLKPHKD